MLWHRMVELDQNSFFNLSKCSLQDLSLHARYKTLTRVICLCMAEDVNIAIEANSLSTQRVYIFLVTYTKYQEFL